MKEFLWLKIGDIDSAMELEFVARTDFVQDTLKKIFLYKESDSEYGIKDGIKVGAERFANKLNIHRLDLLNELKQIEDRGFITFGAVEDSDGDIDVYIWPTQHLLGESSENCG